MSVVLFGLSTVILILLGIGADITIEGIDLVLVALGFLAGGLFFETLPSTRLRK